MTGEKKMSMIEALSDALNGNGVELPDTDRLKNKPFIGELIKREEREVERAGNQDETAR